MKKWLWFAILLVAVFASWLVFWPTYEAWEAQSLQPLIDKAFDVVLGIIILAFAWHRGIKVLK